MASPNIYASGVGGSAGAELATVAPLYTSGVIWYVDSSTGSDAASPRGKERIRPLATLAQAHTNASTGDIIVCLAGHSESLSSAQTFNKNSIKVIGEGSGTNRPQFIRTGDVNMFDVTAAYVLFENIYFAASSLGSASTKSRLRTAGASTKVVNCWFDCGTMDGGPAFELISGTGYVTLTDSTFISTSTDVTAAPASAIKVTNAISDLVMDTVVMDGGDSGWSHPYAFNGAGAMDPIYAKNIDLLNDSDIIFATGTNGHLHIRNQSGSARVVWTA